MIKVEVKPSVSGSVYVYVQTPYHPSFPPSARQLGGKWIPDQKKWAFDPLDERRVRDLVKSVYGTDGNDSAELVNVRVCLRSADATLIEDTDELFMLGRRLAHRRGRDYRVQLDDGVVVISGGFPASGGSMKHPRLQASYGTTLEVRGVPRNPAEDALRHYSAEVITLLPA